MMVSGFSLYNTAREMYFPPCGGLGPVGGGTGRHCLLCPIMELTGTAGEKIFFRLAAVMYRPEEESGIAVFTLL